jgi:hypothetical protein
MTSTYSKPVCTLVFFLPIVVLTLARGIESRPSGDITIDEISEIEAAAIWGSVSTKCVLGGTHYQTGEAGECPKCTSGSNPTCPKVQFTLANNFWTSCSDDPIDPNNPDPNDARPCVDAGETIILEEHQCDADGGLSPDRICADGNCDSMSLQNNCLLCKDGGTTGGVTTYPHAWNCGDAMPD